MQARLRHWPHLALLVTTRIDRQINNNEPDNKPGAGNNIGTEAKMVHVPYRGAAPAITDMLSNRVQVIFDNMPSIVGHIAPGGLRALPVTTATRSPQLPAVPADPEIRKRLVELGGEPLIGTPEAFGAMISSETEKWEKVVKFSGAKGE